jgi:transglutaminase-like putative cysteine protease
MHVKIGCRLRYDTSWETPAVLQVQPRAEGMTRIVHAAWRLSQPCPLHTFADIYENACTRLTIPVGVLEIEYDAVVEISGEPDDFAPEATEAPVQSLPDSTLHFTLPSRYCLSDELGNVAWQLFGSLQPGWGRVQAICDWVHDNIRFSYGTSSPLTTAADIYKARVGVCRDFAHLAVTFCRALNIPARYVFGYLPDIQVPVADAPMDFCAWIEVFLGGRWYTFDPRNNTPRIGHILVGRGRDALDVAMVTSYGAAALTEMLVWADEIAAPPAGDMERPAS